MVYEHWMPWWCGQSVSAGCGGDVRALCVSRGWVATVEVAIELVLTLLCYTTHNARLAVSIQVLCGCTTQGARLAVSSEYGVQW
jgi:hypothetical protein